MSTLRHPALAAFFALVVLCGQAFGLHRGFVCQTGGFEHVTANDHCHGHGEHEEHEFPAHGRDDHDDGDPIHEHPPLKLTQEAEIFVGGGLVTPAAPILAFLPWTSIFENGSGLENPTALLPPRAKSRAGPPLWPPRLARTIALRI